MFKPSSFEMSRRNLLVGTATSVVLGGTARRAAGQSSPDVAARAPALASEAPTLGQVSLRVNGVERDLAVDTRTTLLDLLRERLHLTGTKKGCDCGQCGACTVIVGGRRINSCLALAISHDRADVVTIEGVAHGNRLHPVQEAFL